MEAGNRSRRQGQNATSGPVSSKRQTIKPAFFCSSGHSGLTISLNVIPDPGRGRSRTVSVEFG